jgi:hypothetical protein
MNSTLLKKIAVACTLATPALLMAQSIPFTNGTNLLPTATYSSGNSIGFCDMNGDKRDDIVRSDNTTMSVCYWQAAGNFLESTYTYNLSSPWGMCVGDINNDGINDVQCGEGASSRVMFWNGTTYVGSNVTTNTGAGSIFVQGCNFHDINNDGNLDMFICNDVGMSHIYIGDGTNGWTYNNSVEMPLATAPVSSDNSGNYASVWSDINNDGFMDLMITHCRQGVTQMSDPRRIDQVFINNGDYTYTQDVTNWTGLLDGAQGWSTSFGDMDNDGDMDAFVLNYDVNSHLWVNDGTGAFTQDIMSSSGIANTTTTFGENVTWHDFNNDCFVDLLITGDDHYLYVNNGDGTFTLDAPEPFFYQTGNPLTQRYMRAHCVGDANNDGFLDIYGSYCATYNTPSTSRRDHLWLNDSPNQGNTNHYIYFDLVGGGIPGFSNKNGIGAIVKLYGPWGVQVREVHGGEAYGIQNSFRVHFGLGSATTYDSVIVEWPSGIVDMMLDLPGDQAYTINEGGHPTSTGNINNHPFHMAMGPNPMSEQVTINLFNVEQEGGLDNLSVQIVDLNGKVVYNNTSLNSNTVVINKSELAAGMYIVQVRNANGIVESQKLMVR